ncbi:hypothetical protein SDC9_168622 [bioreactor metagenome]|uniref:Uncharacterized protein n=1 Tax=bioreactor metagenome TaxID=1076179 RepID=A0A645GBI6_9ZZZZ
MFTLLTLAAPSIVISPMLMLALPPPAVMSLALLPDTVMRLLVMSEPAEPLPEAKPGMVILPLWANAAPQDMARKATAVVAIFRIFMILKELRENRNAAFFGTPGDSRGELILSP